MKPSTSGDDVACYQITLTTCYSPVLRTVELCFATDFLFYLSEPNIRDVPMQTGKIVMDVCGTGVIFISRF